MTRLAAYERNGKALAAANGVASALFLSLGIVLMLWAQDWRLLEVIACASVQALVLGVTVYRAKRGRLRAVFRYCFMLLFTLAMTPFWLPIARESRLATMSIIACGPIAGFALAALLTVRRLRELAREGRTDVDLPMALPNEPPGPEQMRS